jgi:hypothetical protein
MSAGVLLAPPLSALAALMGATGVSDKFGSEQVGKGNRGAGRSRVDLQKSRSQCSLL